MNYIVDDLAKIIENKAEGKETINLWLSAQVNSFPHIGTLTNFISAFALAKHYEEYFGKPVKIIVELLESVTGKEEIINDIRYYTNLEKTILDSGERVKDKYLPYFEELLERLKKLNEVDYEIKFFYEYQQDPLVKDALIEVIQNTDKLKNILDPKKGEIRLRFGCPKCGLTEKHLVHTKINSISNDNLSLSSYCPNHGEFRININKDSNDTFDMNVPLRYLIKVMYFIRRNNLNNELNVIVDGGDWSGMWPLRVYMEPLLTLGYTESPSVIYTPTILDWSGSKLSKRMYVGNEAYREFLKEGLINYSEFYNQYGEVGFERIYNEIHEWIKDPKRFIRDYTIEYMDAVLRGEEITKLN